MSASTVEAVRQAGIVGAGGAGFPTHVKLTVKADTFLINGAECEPLLHKDKELLKHDAPTVVRGALLAAEAVGAERVIFGLKAKYTDVVDSVRQTVDGTGVEIKLLGNYYPSGDEYNLTYECTGRLVPAGGIPPMIGCVVANVETLYNIAQAVDNGQPVTETWLTIAGQVDRPQTVRVPVGTPICDLLDVAGNGCADAIVLDGGAMMGQLREDLAYPATKTTGGYIALGRDHYLARRRLLPRSKMHRKGHSACDQCTYCTEFCPRYLLGYEVEPHKVMRTLLFSGRELESHWSRWGQLCCECNLCSLYACPEDLDPKDACVWAKEHFRAAAAPQPEWVDPEKAHPLETGRKVPLERLVRRLGLEPYDHPAPLTTTAITPRRVILPLKQHIGEPCRPLVAVGDQVSRGQLIGDIPKGKPGAPVHASIDGRVTVIDESIVLERI